MAMPSITPYSHWQQRSPSGGFPQPPLNQTVSAQSPAPATAGGIEQLKQQKLGQAEQPPQMPSLDANGDGSINELDKYPIATDPNNQKSSPIEGNNSNITDPLAQDGGAGQMPNRPPAPSQNKPPIGVAKTAMAGIRRRRMEDISARAINGKVTRAEAVQFAETYDAGTKVADAWDRVVAGESTEVVHADFMSNQTKEASAGTSGQPLAMLAGLAIVGGLTKRASDNGMEKEALAPLAALAIPAILGALGAGGTAAYRKATGTSQGLGKDLYQGAWDWSGASLLPTNLINKNLGDSKKGWLPSMWGSRGQFGSKGGMSEEQEQFYNKLEDPEAKAFFAAGGGATDADRNYMMQQGITSAAQMGEASQQNQGGGPVGPTGQPGPQGQPEAARSLDSYDRFQWYNPADWFGMNEEDEYQQALQAQGGGQQGQPGPGAGQQPWGGGYSSQQPSWGGGMQQYPGTMPYADQLYQLGLKRGKRKARRRRQRRSDRFSTLPATAAPAAPVAPPTATAPVSPAPVAPAAPAAPAPAAPAPAAVHPGTSPDAPFPSHPTPGRAEPDYTTRSGSIPDDAYGDSYMSQANAWATDMDNPIPPENVHTPIPGYNEKGSQYLALVEKSASDAGVVMDPLAIGFVAGCCERGMNADQIFLAAEKTAESFPELAEKLAMDKEAYAGWIKGILAGAKAIPKMFGAGKAAIPAVGKGEAALPFLSKIKSFLGGATKHVGDAARAGSEAVTGAADATKPLAAFMPGGARHSKATLGQAPWFSMKNTAGKVVTPGKLNRVWNAPWAQPFRGGASGGILGMSVDEIGDYTGLYDTGGMGAKIGLGLGLGFRNPWAARAAAKAVPGSATAKALNIGKGLTSFRGLAPGAGVIAKGGSKIPHLAHEGAMWAPLAMGAINSVGQRGAVAKGDEMAQQLGFDTFQDFLTSPMGQGIKGYNKSGILGALSGVWGSLSPQQKMTMMAALGLGGAGLVSAMSGKTGLGLGLGAAGLGMGAYGMGAFGNAPGNLESVLSGANLSQDQASQLEDVFNNREFAEQFYNLPKGQQSEVMQNILAQLQATGEAQQ